MFPPIQCEENMKDALASMLGKGTEETGTASPAPYEGDFALAGDESNEEGGMEEGLRGEITGLLATATPDQLQSIKDILSPVSDMPPMDGGAPKSSPSAGNPFSKPGKLPPM